MNIFYFAMSIYNKIFKLALLGLLRGESGIWRAGAEKYRVTATIMKNGAPGCAVSFQAKALDYTRERTVLPGSEITTSTRRLIARLVSVLFAATGKSLP